MAGQEQALLVLQADLVVAELASVVLHIQEGPVIRLAQAHHKATVVDQVLQEADTE